ncbi:hypothetical protein P5618_017985 [Priestia megaterium]|nr:hypothetical protein [Priestia megaterium]MDH3180355.1 hypothetical protein [Priestia megaterium]
MKKLLPFLFLAALYLYDSSYNHTAFYINQLFRRFYMRQLS